MHSKVHAGRIYFLDNQFIQINVSATEAKQSLIFVFDIHYYAINQKVFSFMSVQD